MRATTSSLAEFSIRASASLGFRRRCGLTKRMHSQSRFRFVIASSQSDSLRSALGGEQ